MITFQSQGTLFPSRLTHHPSFVIVRSENPKLCFVSELWAAGGMMKRAETKKGFRNE